jgi:glycosyltransferase involved in cell wall biosynthesis
MNILFSIHLYPPAHLCGAEMMAHRMIKHLQSKGHHVRVLLHQANHYKITTTYTYDGVDVFPPNANVIENLFRWSHCVFTHLDYTRWTIGAAGLYKKPVFHLIHNTHKYPEIENANSSQHIVYNSLWAKQKLGYKWSNFILTPPTDYRDFELGVDSADNEYITLINLNENKGGEIFYQIAKAMPHKKFLGVKGSYDEQIIKDLPNITYIDKTTNILSVYQKTRILLMPSKYESWGITATEAMCCGIPVISTEAEGLKENCAKAGIFIKDRNDIESWVKEINKLDDAKAYAAASKKAKGRGREHDPRKALDEFEQWLREEVNKYNG